jgi:hypothetical protein
MFLKGRDGQRKNICEPKSPDGQQEACMQEVHVHTSPQPRTKQFFYPDAVIILLHNKVLIFFARVLRGKNPAGFA